MKQQFLKGKTGTIKLSIYSNNRPIVPSSAKITLYEPGGTSELQAQDTATVDATTGEMSYSLTTTHTADHDINYKALWEYEYGGSTYYETQLFDVVKSILAIPLTDEDVYNELESLRKANKQATGTATAGAAGSLTDTVRRKEDDNYWKGGTIEILKGTGVGQIRDVTGSTQSTGVITVTPNWATNPSTDSVYRIVQSFTRKIKQSFEKLETMLYDKGKRHSLILESSQIKFPLLYLTVHFICLDLSDEINDKWFTLADKYWNHFETAFSNMKLEYDVDESGGIDEDEEAHHASEIRIGRG